MQKKQYIILTAVVVITLLTTSGSAIASTLGHKNLAGFSSHTKNNPRGMRPGVGGAVAAINGTTLTITGQNGITYTVDTTNAKITKGFGPNSQTLALADIKVGDKIGVMGTVSGTNVTAKTIIDGVGMMRGKETDGQAKMHLAGKIVDVSPYSFTLEIRSFPGKKDAASSTLTYTLDTTSSTLVTKDGQSASLGDLTAGQMVIVTGNIDNAAKTAVATKINIMILKAKRAGMFGKMRMMKMMKKNK